MHRVLWLGLLATACGRFGFELDDGARDAATDGSAAIDGAQVDAVPGVRGLQWLRTMAPDVGGDPTALRPHLASGPGGGLVAMARFAGPITLDLGEQSLTFGGAGLASTLVAQLTRDGKSATTTLLRADSFCDMRDATVHPIRGLMVAGITAGGGGGELGPCDAVTTPQHPIAFAIDPAGVPTVAALIPSSGNNAQGWAIAPLPGDAYALAGIYGGDVTLSPPVGTAIDEAAFLTRVQGSGATDRSRGWNPSGQVFAGPVSTIADGTLCLLGSHNTPFSIDATAVTHVGAFDAFIARFTPDGSLDSVLSLGSTGNEAAFGNGDVLAMDDGCWAALSYAGAETTLALPHTGGDDALLVRLGGARASMTFNSAGNEAFGSLTAIGGRLFATLEFDGAITIDGNILTAQGQDIAVVEIDRSTLTTSLLAHITGAGAQHTSALGHVDGGAITVAFINDGALVIDAFTVTHADPTAVYAVFGVGE